MGYNIQDVMLVNSLSKCLSAPDRFNTNKDNNELSFSNNSKILSLLGNNIDMDIDTSIALAFSCANNLGYESGFDINFIYSVLAASGEIKSNNTSNENEVALFFGKNQNKKYNILIAEDEYINFEVLKMLLQISLGVDCNIIHAENGEEAIEICRNNPDIDMVLMDIRMPKVTGLEATKQIKEEFPELPIVAQTAYAGEKEKNNAENAGCNDFITKPIEKDILKSILKKYLK